MAPKIRIQAKAVKKTPSKKKTKAKRRKKVPFKVPQEIQDKCKDWVLEQKRIPKTEFDLSFVEELPSDDDDEEVQDETQENPANYEVPFRQLHKHNSDAPTVKMMLECEWHGCYREFVKAKDYLAHIGEHMVELRNENEIDGMFLRRIPDPIFIRTLFRSVRV